MTAEKTWPASSILGDAWQKWKDAEQVAHDLAQEGHRQCQALRDFAPRYRQLEFALDRQGADVATIRAQKAELDAEVEKLRLHYDWLLTEERKALQVREDSEDRYACLVGEWRFQSAELERLQSQRPRPIGHIATIQSRINDLTLALEIVE